MQFDNHLSFIRFGKWNAIDASAGATFKTDNAMTDAEAVDAIRRAVTKWCQETEDGKHVYASAADDLNIGDLASFGIETLRPYLEAEGIFNFDITDTIKPPSGYLPYDQVLVDDIEETP